MESISLTYEELAARLGVATDSARIKAKRRKWPVTQGNDGKARVLVPPEALAEASPEQGPSVRGALEERIAILQEQLVETRVAQGRAEAERDAARDGRTVEVAARDQVIAELKVMLADARAELAEARRPWFSRLRWRQN